MLQAGGFYYREVVPELNDCQCVSSSLGTAYADGFTDKRYHFDDGSEVLEYRGSLTIYLGTGRAGIVRLVRN